MLKLKSLLEEGKTTAQSRQVHAEDVGSGSAARGSRIRR
jgi:hypothetical protein